jgi:catechol 2,3-dioxygenase-like lactoylglutathione lyase family enzyme
MTITNVLAVMCVADMGVARPWYAKLLGREPDRTPMPESSEWRLTDGGWLQVVQDPSHAGQSIVTVNVDDLERASADFASRGVQIGGINEVTQFKLAAVRDPDGNTLTFAEVLASEAPASEALASGEESGRS